MQPLDDSIPEEREPSNAALVSMLRQAASHPVQLSAGEQEELLERAQQRLLSTGQASPIDNEQRFQPAGTTGSIPLKQTATRPFTNRRGRSRLIQFASMLAAVLVIAAITGASLLLFQHRQAQKTASTPTSIQPPSGMVTVKSSAGGFEMSFSLMPGPYFLSELLAAQISLTNHTDKTAYVGLPFGGSACGYVTGIQVTGEDNPQFVIPIPTVHSCPFSINDTAIKPGQTLTVVKYLPLTNSGHLTLTAETEFYSSAFQPPYQFPKQIGSPLDGHWPTMSINVTSKIPAGRTISYHRVGSRIFIDAPRPVQYLYSVYCYDFNNDGGTTGTGDYGWESLTKNVVGEPGCPGKNVHWAFAFGLPGYGIVQGSVIFPGNDPNP
jgi:hypothetical protein